MIRDCIPGGINKNYDKMNCMIKELQSVGMFYEFPKGNGGLMLELDYYNGQENGEVFTPSLDSGDFLMMQPYLIHSSGPNASENSRMTL